uniref:Uncharacterized protein n=1 Tax=Arundo donax TaxID=35708 RepID=A0A0A9FSB8_ARUDO
MLSGPPDITSSLGTHLCITDLLRRRECRRRLVERWRRLSTLSETIPKCRCRGDRVRSRPPLPVLPPSVPHFASLRPRPTKEAR